MIFYDEKNISIGELIDHISRLQNDVNTLMIAFSYLAFSLSREQMLPTLASIHFESLNVNGRQNNKNLLNFLHHYWKNSMAVTLLCQKCERNNNFIAYTEDFFCFK